MWLTGGLFNRVVDEAPDAFSRLRLVLTGGETMSLAHARRFLAAHPTIRLINAYGPTENTCITAAHAVAPRDLDGPIPIGRPIAGTRVLIVDQRLRPSPIGAWGELVCAGDGVALGYAGRSDLTAKSFVELPWGSHERVYRTGVHRAGTRGHAEGPQPRLDVAGDGGAQFRDDHPRRAVHRDEPYLSPTEPQQLGGLGQATVGFG